MTPITPDGHDHLNEKAEDSFDNPRLPLRMKITCLVVIVLGAILFVGGAILIARMP